MNKWIKAVGLLVCFGSVFCLCIHPIFWLGPPVGILIFAAGRIADEIRK